MAEAKFSWLKVASFVGALVFAIVCLVMLGLGFNMVKAGYSFQGCMFVISGVLCGVSAYQVYMNYQKKSLEDR